MSFFFYIKTTGTYNFVSVILNLAPDGATIAGSASASTVKSAKIQFLDQVKLKSVQFYFAIN